MKVSTKALRAALTLLWLVLAICAVSVKYPRFWMSPSLAGESPHTRGAASPDAGESAASRPVLPTIPAEASFPRADTIAPRASPQQRSDVDEVARALQRAGRNSEAVAAYESAHAGGDLTPDDRVQYAWLLNLERRYADAWQVVASLGDSARAHLEVRARTAAWAGRLEDAAALLPRWLAVAPRDEVAWALLADVQRRLGTSAAHMESLRRLLDLQPEEPDVRRHLAGHLAASGDVRGAIEHLQQVVERAPHATSDLVSLALLYEQAGRLPDAIATYEMAVARGHVDADVYRRLARVLRWTDQHEKAIDSYARYLSAVPELEPDVAGEFGLALLNAGRPQDALTQLDAALSRDRHDADLWVAAARAAAALGQSGRAAYYLRALGGMRPLTNDEANWLAGQLEAAGDVTEAVTVLHELLETSAEPNALWERIGDLEATASRPIAALEAYEQILAEAAPSALWLKAARAAAAAGNQEKAARAYDRALELRPGDAGLLLEGARHYAATGEPVRALTLYERHLAMSHMVSGLSLELTRAALAARRPQAALRWANAGIAAGEADAALLYAQAQALQLVGRPTEAAALLQRLLAQSPGQPEWRTWLARTAQARGRHLEAYEQFGAVLQDTDRDSAELWIARGDAAADGGDVMRARQAYEQARAAGAGERLVAERLQALPAPLLAAPVEIMRDSNHVELARAGGQLFLWPAHFGRVAASWTAGHMRQAQGPTFSERSVEVRVDDVFPTPRVRLQGGLGLQQAHQAALTLWHAAARYGWPDGGSVAVETFRETPWSAPPRPRVLRFNRINDLNATGALFHNTGGRAMIDLPLDDDQALQAEVGARHYSDGNVSRELYLQYQRRLSGNGTTWVAVQPHLYAEQWERTSPAYFSPDLHATVGVTLRAIADRRSWTVDTAVTPQALFSSGREGVGAMLSGGLTRRIGRGSAGANVLWFSDRRYRFNLWHLSGEVRIPVGK